MTTRTIILGMLDTLAMLTLLLLALLCGTEPTNSPLMRVYVCAVLLWSASRVWKGW